MKRRVFLNVLAITLVAFVACQTITLIVLYRYVTEQRREELRSELQYFGEVVETYGGDFLSKLSLQNDADGAIRLTLVDETGAVLFDSAKQPESLNNHKERQEIKQAFERGYGESTRVSDTLRRHTYNYAILLKTGEVLRISGSQYTMFSLVLSMFSPMIVVLSCVVLLAIYLANRISRSITGPINAIDLESPDARSIYPELRPLAERINEQNRQLHRQVMELKNEHERQDRLRREFTANVSHELKTPLTSISGYAEILSAGLVKEEDIPRFANKILDESNRLRALVSDILRLSQLDEGGLTKPWEKVSLSDLCGRTLERLAVAARTRGIVPVFERDDETEAYDIWGDSGILEEIIYNLCDNAIKYNVENGGLTVRLAKEDEHVCLTVSDTGIGIPREAQERVFERFYRVDKSHSKEVGGTGLGLSIVKHGVAYHHGTIRMQSEEGKGTSITLCFPGCDGLPEEKA